MHTSSMHTGSAAQGKSSPHNLTLGILAICAAFFLSALTGVLSKFTHGVSPLLTVFFQYGVSALVFLPLALRHGWSGLRSAHTSLQITRSIVGCAAQLLYFLSLGALPLLDASLLSNASPLFIPIVVWLWLKKPVSATVWVSLAIGLAGVILVIHPGPALFHQPASLIALLSGVCSAVGLVATNRLAETDPPFRILAYNFGTSTLLLAPFALWKWQHISAHDVLLLVALGLCFAGTQWLIILAYHFGSATELSPFNYSVVIFSGLLGWAVFGTVPSLTAVIGTILICAGGIASIEAGHIEGLGHWIGAGHWGRLWATHWHPRRHLASRSAGEP